MLSLKKKLYLLKIKQFCSENSTVLFYQYSHINIIEKNKLKNANKVIQKGHFDNKVQEFYSIEGGAKNSSQYIDILVIKNKLALKWLENFLSTKNNRIKQRDLALFQGPIILLSLKNSRVTVKAKEYALHAASTGPLVEACSSNKPAILVNTDFKKIKEIFDYLDKNKKLLFLGCLTDNQIINHLDFKKLLQLDHTIFNKFLFILTAPLKNFKVLNNFFNFSFLTENKKALLSTLTLVKRKAEPEL